MIDPTKRLISSTLEKIFFCLIWEFFQADDHLRQYVLGNQMLKMINNIWKTEGPISVDANNTYILDLNLTPNRVLSVPRMMDNNELREFDFIELINGRE